MQGKIVQMEGLVRDLLTQEKQMEISQCVSKVDMSNIKPMESLSEVLGSEINDTIVVYFHLMVQDFREPEFYASTLISQPVTPESQILTHHFGLPHPQFLSALQASNFYQILSSREVVVCCSPPYESSWVKDLKKQKKEFRNINLILEVKEQFKLGQQIFGVGLWHPQNESLYFLRMLTVEQKQVFYPHQHLPFETQFKTAKQKFLKYLSPLCGSLNAQMLLFSMISDQPIFVGGINSSVIPALGDISPRVCHLRVKAPIPDSFFPYKNASGELIQTPLQLSSQKTFVILDFSQFCEEKEVKICQAEIDNLKALKIFVEEGQVIYRWEYGESLVPHQHSGLVIKASKIISPHFNVLKQEEKMEEIQKIILSEGEKRELRGYISSCQNVKSFLSEDSRAKIEEYLKQNQSDLKNKNLGKILKLAKFNAMSLGSPVINFDDFMSGLKMEKNQIVS